MAISKKLRTYLITAVIVVAVIIGGYFTYTVGAKAFGKFFDKNKKDDGKNETPIDTNKPPVAVLVADKLVTYEDVPIKLDGFNQSYDPDAPKNQTSNGIMKYIWDYGDGGAQETTNEGTVFKTYGNPGIYVVTMTVVDEDDATDTDNLTLKIVPANLSISTVSQIMLADPLIGILPNSTEVNWTIKEEAKVMNLTISITGGDFREVQQNKVEVVLFNPYEDVMKNETVTVLGGRNIQWEFMEDEIDVPGEYYMLIRCLKGMATVQVNGMVYYL